MQGEIVLFEVGSGGEMGAVPQDGALGLWKPGSAFAHLQFPGLGPPWIEQDHPWQIEAAQ